MTRSPPRPPSRPRARRSRRWPRPRRRRGRSSRSRFPLPRRRPRRSQPAEPDPAAITLRLPEGEQDATDEVLTVGVEPGGRTRLIALVRNQSQIVDNYELSVRGLPDDWWSIFPNTVYLVPFGTSGTYEQEVEIHLHPPRSPQAEARLWELEVVGESKAYTQAGRGGAAVTGDPPVRGVQDQALARARVRPQEGPVRRLGQQHRQRPADRRTRRRRPGQRAQYKFSPSALEIPPGQTRQVEDAGQAAAHSAGSAARRRSASRSSPRPARRPTRPRRRRTWTCPRARSRRARTRAAAWAARPARWPSSRRRGWPRDFATSSAPRACASARAASRCRRAA